MLWSDEKSSIRRVMKTFPFFYSYSASRVVKRNVVILSLVEGKSRQDEMTMTTESWAAKITWEHLIRTLSVSAFFLSFLHTANDIKIKLIFRVVIPSTGQDVDCGNLLVIITKTKWARDGNLLGEFCKMLSF